eukprot:TRINITY_DN11222_c0_g1_i10.p2 TRINITY_DN11222_c0_g1~~TRINITY_DN11222_c0_g1_i10.p2  ORF type:complete len:259 (+),score=73.75 TRINITY_DN11222_c0_g1_i10:1580-2356(+)
MASRFALAAVAEACSTRMVQHAGSSMRASLRPRKIARPVSTRSFTKWFSTKQPLSDDKADANATDSKSDDSKAASEAQQAAADVDNASEGAMDDHLKQALEDVELYKTQATENKDKYLRALAEMENLRERSKRDVSDARDFAMHKFAKDLLEFVDNLERAMAYVPKEELEGDKNLPLKNLYEGLDGTYKQLHTVFSRHGIERLEPQDQKFDPELHEALFQIPTPEGKEPNTVAEVTQSGYVLKGRLVRAAGVGVFVKN